MKPEKGGIPSSEHEKVYHAASGCQAASLSLTPRRLHGQKNACSVEGKKTGSFASPRKALLSCFGGMQMSGRLKSRRSVGLMRCEHGENDPHPNVRECTDGDTMTFPFCAFALVIGQRPIFLQRALPGKLMQSIPQRLDTPQSSVGLRVISTLKQDRRGATQGLQTGSCLITSRIISDFSEHARSQALASSGQAAEDNVVFMAQKKLLDLFVICSDLLYQGLELDDQGHRQARFRPGRDRIGSQTGLMQVLEDLGGHVLGRGMTGGLEELTDLLNRSSLRRFQGWIGLQKHQGRALLQLGKEVQCDGIIGFQAGRQLVDQAGLHMDQAVLITCEPLEFGHLLTVGRESVQIREVGSPGLRQHIGIDSIGLRTRGRALPINGAWINRIHRPPLFQQERNKQAVVGLNNAGHLFLVLATKRARKPGIQLVKSFWGMGNTDRTELSPSFVKNQSIMLLVCPIDTSIEHGKTPSVLTTFLSNCALILWCSKHDFLIISCSQKHRRRSASFLNRSSRVERIAFLQRVQQFTRASGTLAPALCRGGLV